ncbi:MAG: hypothetical protein JW759_07910 [Candidatus Coatesbacteria bacterium]|nr:hypothetical protein [Candidatus Coatesbacteria bacterium]
MDIKLVVPEDRELPLRLRELESGTPALTPVVGAFYAQAASVCLQDQGHSSPTPMLISGEVTGSAAVEWDPTSDQIRRSWSHDKQTTEHGAYGIACVLVPQLSGLQVVERARIGTGVDFWLGRTDDSEWPFQNCARLEVTGIREGPKGAIGPREQRKLKQTQRSDASLLPAIVVVVEFSQPESRVSKR